MPKVMDMANIRGFTAGESESVDSNAFLLWTAITGRKRSDASSRVWDDLSGWEYNGSLTSVIFSLWPALSHKDMERQLHNFRSDIYKFLKESGNARCLNPGRGTGRDVVWWIGDRWRPAGSFVTLIHTKAVPTAAEKRLTPHEAGEDRPPSEVTTNLAITTEDTVNVRTKDDPLKKSRDKRTEEHVMLLEMAYEFLVKETDGQPVVSNEIASVLGVSVSTGRSLGTELVAAGRAYSRQETGDERAVRFGLPTKATASVMFSTIDPVPIRTKRQVVSGYTATVAPTGAEGIKHGQVSLSLLRYITTTYQPVHEIATKAGITVPRARGNLKLLLAKKLVEESYHRRNGSSRMLSYRIPGGTRGLAIAREAQAKALADAGAETIMPTKRVTSHIEQAPAKAASAPKPKLAGGMQDLMIDIENLVTRYAAQAVSNVAIDTTYIEELERKNSLLQTKVDELEGVLAPLRMFLGGKA